MVAVLPSMIDAEQYFDFDSSITCHGFRLELSAADLEMKVDPGECLWLRLGAFGVQAYLATGYPVSSFLEDRHNVKCRATAGARQSNSIGRGAMSRPPASGAPSMTIACLLGLRQERHAVSDPFDCAIHDVPLVPFGR